MKNFVKINCYSWFSSTEITELRLDLNKVTTYRPAVWEADGHINKYRIVLVSGGEIYFRTEEEMNKVLQSLDRKLEVSDLCEKEIIEDYQAI